MSTLSWLDFNTGVSDHDLTEASAYDVADIKARLVARLPEVARYLFPNADIRNGQCFVGSIRGEKGKSLVLQLTGARAGLWMDFAENDKGDVFELWARVHGWRCDRDFRQVLQSIAQWLGYPVEDHITREVIHAEARARREHDHVEAVDSGKVVGKWDYFDRDKNLIACVYRYEDDLGNKSYRPWDVIQRRYGAPRLRPLYNQPGIIQSDTVVLVEGEKCAQALINIGICATTAMNGANAPIPKTDWSPLKRKNVLLWPDNDPSGKAYMEKVRDVLATVAARCTIVSIPKEKPEKWDAADALQEDFDVRQFLQLSSQTVSTSSRLNLVHWLAKEAFAGEPTPRQWLIEGVFPIGQVALIAAAGGVGKSYLLAQLARDVAVHDGLRLNAPRRFGGTLLAHGATVYVTAEDDRIEVHTRLRQLGAIPDALYCVPLPDAGGAQPFFRVDPVHRSPATTEAWRSLESQLRDIEGLRLIVLDPLQPLCALDLNLSEHAQFVCSTLAALAANLNASVIVSHHFSKREVASPEQAREAIRGSGGLVDGVRSCYALWQPPQKDAEAIAKRVQRHYQRGDVVKGAIVKANGKANLDVTTYIRDPKMGILVDRSDELHNTVDTKRSLLSDLVLAIANAAIEGKPYTKTGLNGLHERRFELPESFHSIGKHRFGQWVDELQQLGKIVTAMAPGQTTVKWLDVPTGPVAMGEAEFHAGHLAKSVGARA